MRFVRCALVLLTLWATGRASAQPLRFDRLGLAEGLPDHTVYDLLQDRRGFLWMATEGGLVRYDGYTFTTFRFDPADPNTLPTNVLTALLEDRAGMLWVGTNRGGINRLDPRTGHITRYALSDGEARIGQLEEDWRGGLWARRIGHPHGSGFYHRPPDSAGFRWVALPDSFSTAGAPVLLGRGGSVWAALGPGRLSRLDLPTGARRTYHLPARPQGASAQSLMEDQEGLIWIRFEETLCRLDPATGQVTSYRVRGLEAVRGSARRVLFRDDALWLATESGLFIAHLLQGKVTAHRHVPNDPHSLAPGRLVSIYADRSGIVWLGVLSAGLCRVVPQRQQFGHFYHVPGQPGSLAGNHVFAAFEDSAGRLHVSTAAGGVQRYDESTGAFAQVSFGGEAYTGSAVPRVRTLHEDRFGGRWYGTWGHGLFHAPPGGRLRHYRFGTSADAQAMRVLFEDRGGTLWAGTEVGLFRYDRTRDRFEHLALPDAEAAVLAGAPVWAMTEDRQGRLWIGTYGSGLFRLDPHAGTLRRFQHDPAAPHSLSSDDVSALHEDEQGRLWVGTYGGALNRWQPESGTFRRYTTADGFPSPYVHGILQDGAGDLWISTNSGLVRFTPAEGTFRTYDAEDGLQSNRFGPGVFLKRRDGSFVFGGINGFNWFDPARIAEGRYRPPVAVTAFSVRGLTIALDSLLERVGHVPIPWAQNEFTFELAALDFAAPQQNQYAHWLEGYEAEWRHTGTRRYASYTNLDPGRYVLHVKGAGSAGLWSTQEVRIPLYVVPPFWRTGWFRLLAGLALLAAVALTVRYASTRKLQKRLRQFEMERRLQAERERISRDLHDHVGAQLAYIIASLDLNTRQLAELGVSTQQRQLQGLRHHARTTMRQLRETIWALRQETVTVGELAERIEVHAAQQTRDLGEPRLHVTEAVASDVSLSPSRALNIFRVAQEALTNALKHAQAQNLYVRVRTEGPETLVVEIEDDGTGLRETQGDGAAGSGYGLKNMQRRAEELGGVLVLEAPPSGTRVRLTVPL